MRNSIIIAVLAFVAGAASTWAVGNSSASARYTLSGAAEQSINVLDLTMKAGMLPSQSFDAH